MTSYDHYLEYKDVMVQIASEFRRKYPMVDIDDIQQEMFLWFVTHPRKFKEWTALPEKESTKLIAKSLRNAAIKYCEKEKARSQGYDMSDIYYYDVSVVEAFLPTIIAESYEMPAKIKDLGDQIKSGEISDGMNWLALRSDIAAAYYRLSEAKQNILRIRFSNDTAEWSKTAEELGTTADGARMKVQRALASLVQHLGGWRPYNDKDQQEVGESGGESTKQTEGDD